ncbi:MAG: hypothetical protein E7Z66_00350 [Thermoplasmata archaeon]|nr:hypothetical protein [Thermoplasmata archaeon]
MSRLLICCTQDLPSVNMAKYLTSKYEWEDLGSDGNNTYVSRNNDVLMTIDSLHITAENIDEVAKEFGVKVDSVVFLSRHKAASGIPTLTVHPIGNYKAADFGGREGTLVASDPHGMTEALRFVQKYNDTEEYKVSFEVTHHGPYLEKPTYFIEIGSDETHWGDEHAAEILSNAVAESDGKEYPVALGFGGGHYAPRFTEMALGYKIDFGHMIPGYQLDSLSDEDVLAILKKASDATNGTKCVYMHHKAFKKSEDRRFTELMESAGYEIISSKDLEPL